MPSRLTLGRVEPIIDAHLDLAYLAERGIDLLSPSTNPDVSAVNLPALDAGGVRLVFATIFTESVDATRNPEPWEYCGPDDAERAQRAGERQLERYLELERRSVIRIVRCASDLQPLADDGPLQVVILMEGADPISDAAPFRRWFDAGVRIVALAWARGSRFSGGNAAPGPITPRGLELLEEMESCGAILDCSHLSDDSFDQALDRFGGSIIASHSNCRALLESTQRHLRDDQIERIAERAGVIGLNLYGKFLASGRAATMDDAVAHCLRLRELAGADRIGLGSDLDGGFAPTECPEGLRRPEDLHGLLAALGIAGFEQSEVRSFANGSWLGLLRRALPP